MKSLFILNNHRVIAQVGLASKLSRIDFGQDLNYLVFPFPKIKQNVRFEKHFASVQIHRGILKNYSDTKEDFNFNYVIIYSHPLMQVHFFSTRKGVTVAHQILQNCTISSGKKYITQMDFLFLIYMYDYSPSGQYIFNHVISIRESKTEGLVKLQYA